jgi:glycosyltransferase involved in cell wall biosynthesis
VIISNASIAQLYASGEFDPDYYTRAYPDVGHTGLDPAAHFLWLGSKLGRRGRPPQGLLEQSRPDRLDVLFVDGTNGTSSSPYRVSRVAEGLAEAGLRVECIYGDELAAGEHDRLRSRVVTFFRAPFWNSYCSFAEKMRVNGSTIVFDIDDLVFDEDFIPVIDGYRLLTEPEKLGYVRGVQAYRQFVLYADLCTAPTHFLADQMAAMGKRTFRVRNTLAKDDIKMLAGARPRVRGERFVIGYYSGSRTHQADFRHAGEALADFMDENPTIDFRLVGSFDLGEYPRLAKWTRGTDGSPRLRHLGLMPHSQMLQDQLECDLIIAPLEVGNAFCEAKSELKFFEASLASRPVIASPTATYRSATGDGRFGQLADSREEWLDAFRMAFAQREQTAQRARLAHDHVMREYAPAAAAAEVIEAYSKLSSSSRGTSTAPRSAVAKSNPIG